MNLFEVAALAAEIVTVYEELKADGTIAEIEKDIANNPALLSIEQLIGQKAETNPKLADLVSKIAAIKA